MKMKLISNWKEGWKFLSVHCMSLAGAIQATWLLIPEDMKRTLDPKFVAVLTLSLVIFGIVGRFIDQKNVTKP